MLTIKREKQFKKDVKACERANKDFTDFKKILFLLINEKALPRKCDDHKLIGNYLGHRECKIKPDWLLIYRIEDSDLILTRTGSHSKLFKK